MVKRRAFFPVSVRAPAGRWNPLTLAALAGAWLAVLPNWPLWQSLAALPEMGSLRGWIFRLGFGLLIGALLTALLAVVAWPRWIKGSITAMFVAAAFGAHFMGSYGVVIDSTMMATVLQTDAREVRDLLNLRLALNLSVLAILPLLFFWTAPIARIGGGRQLRRNLIGVATSLLLVAVLTMTFFADFSATMRNHKTLRYLINPLNSLYALVDLGWHTRSVVASGPPRPIGMDAKPLQRAAGVKPPLLLLVVGETARADHFALNGYDRPTDPALGALDVVSYTAVTSCGTNTAASLPCMFSTLGKRAFEAREADSENLLDLAQRAGYAVLWVDNQAGCKGLCDRVPHAFAADATVGHGATQSGKEAVCDAGECLDEALLIDLDLRLAALPAERRRRGALVVLHQMGSHGPAYWLRSPSGQKPFLPECTTNVLQQCERQSLINAYDNSVAYTDHLLARAIGWLSAREADYDTSLLYVSDHGESLGENGIYLHGLPYAIAPREQTHVPWIVWLSPQTAAHAGSSVACLRSQKNAPLSHDNLFHTVLGVLGIQAGEYRAALDAFAACRKL